MVSFLVCEVLFVRAFVWFFLNSIQFNSIYTIYWELSKYFCYLSMTAHREKTALIITYDEHGGFFDHVSPPTGVPNPDGLNSTDDPFDFTRLGE